MEAILQNGLTSGDVGEFSFAPGSVIVTIGVSNSEALNVLRTAISTGKLIVLYDGQEIVPTLSSPTPGLKVTGAGSLGSSIQHLPSGSVVASVDGSLLSEKLAGMLTASLGPVSGSSAYSIRLKAAATVAGTLISGSTIFHDGPVLRAAFQVRDEDGNVRVDPAASRVHLSVTVGAESLNATCTPASDSGVCTAEVSIPAGAFGSISVGVNSMYRLESNPADFHLLAESQLAVTPLVEVTNNLHVQLPFRDVLPGTIFTAPVYGRLGDFSISMFWIEFKTDASAITVLEPDYDANVWSITTVSSKSGDAIGINALAADPASRPVVASGPELLFTARFQVSADITASQLSSISATVMYLKTSEQLVNTATAAECQQRNRVVTLASGSVSLFADAPAALFAFMPQSQVVNIAPLVLQKQSMPVYFVTVSRSGTVRASKDLAGLSCTSLGVVSLGADCQTVQFESWNSNSGSDRVSYSLSELRASLPVTVWGAENVRIVLGDMSLERIANLKKAGTCEEVFQTSTLQVLADLASSSAGVISNVIVTSTFAPFLRTENAGVVQIDTADPDAVVVRGLSEGTNSVMIGQLVSVPVVVSSDAVRITALDAQLVRSISVAPLGSAALASAQEIRQFTVTVNSQLEEEFQRAFVHVSGVLSDGTRMSLVGESSRIRIESLNTAVVNTTQQALEVQAVGSGVGALVIVELNDRCGSMPAYGVADVEVALPAPLSATVEVSSPEIAPERDTAAAGVGIPTTATVRVFLNFATGRRQEMTMDPRTIIMSSDLLSVSKGASSVLVTAPANGAGVGRVSVQFTHVNLTNEAVVAVVASQHINLTSSPFPTFTNSDSMQASPLNLIAATGVYQQARLHAVLSLSNGRSVDVSTTAGVSFKGSGSFAVTSPNILSASAAGAITLQASFGAQTSSSHTITVSDAPVSVTEILIDANSFPATFAGVPNTQRYVQVGVAFNDGTLYPRAALFPSPASPAVLGNLLVFTSSQDSIVSVDAATGLATLIENYHSKVDIQIRAVDAAGSVSGKVSFNANLNPAAADVDLGATSGAPLLSSTVGATFDVPVRINTGGSNRVNAIQLAIVYDAGQLEVVETQPGTDWPGGSYHDTINDPPGTLLIGGTPLDITGGVKHISTVTFRVLPGAGGKTVEVSGRIVTMADNDLDLAAANAAFVAGHVSFQVAGISRRRRDEQEPEEAAAAPLRLIGGTTPSASTRQRRSACASPPCEYCDTARPLGDVNGDCTFSIKDAKKLQTYLLEVSRNAVSSVYYQEQLDLMDADQNGVVDLADASYLLHVSFKLYRFFTDLQISPVSSDTDCALELKVKVLMGNDEPAPAAQTFVYFDLESTAPALQAQLASSTMIQGTRIAASKGAGFNGGLLLAIALGDNFYGVKVDSQLKLDSIGVSLIIATTSETGVGSPARTTSLLSGNYSQPFMYTSKLQLALSVSQDTTVRLSNTGYNPLRLFDARTTTFECSPNICDTKPCMNGGTCATQDKKQFVCTCPPGFVGTFCEEMTNLCTIHAPCQNGAPCTPLLNNYMCACPAGFSGKNCSTNINECSSHDCVNGAECVDGVNGYTCNCAAGYTGRYCEAEIDGCAISNPCGANGKCSSKLGKTSCTCNAGYEGSLCSTKIRYCASNPCLNGGSCSEATLSFRCDCTGTGFSGALCSVNVDECLASPCKNNGTCTDNPFGPGFTCACPTGFYNATCSYAFCDNPANACVNGGTCSNRQLSCICPAGWRGERCQIKTETVVEPLTDTTSDNKGAQVGIWIAVAATVAIASMILMYLYRRSRQQEYGTEILPMHSKGLSMDWEGIDDSIEPVNAMRYPEFVPPPTMETKEIARFKPLAGAQSGSRESQTAQLKFLDERVDTNGYDHNLYKDEFKNMAKKKAGATFNSANADENRPKNRYRDVLPYDDTRVRLSDPDNDYINANHCSATVAGRTFWYIACQGPLKSTIEDFWRMCMEQGARMIVMVSAEVENGTVKCDRYWPKEEGEKGTEIFGDFRVTLVRTATSASYCIRGLKIKNTLTGEKRTVWHLQFFAWPDHGVPMNVNDFLAFVEEVRAVRHRLNGDAAQPPSPTILHCSAGIGRTGVLMTIEVTLAKVDAGEMPDIKYVLEELREQRPSLVQTLEQYKFCYDAVRQHLTQG